MQIEALIERLEKLDGPNPHIDEQIWEAVGGWPEHEYRSVNYMRLFGTPVTASLDAAIALTEKVLPGWMWRVAGEHPEFSGVRPSASLWKLDTDVAITEPIEASAPTPAIALLIALLHALQSGGRS